MVDEPRDRRGTRRLFVWGAAAAAALGIIVLAWPLLPVQDTRQSRSDPTGIRWNQQQGESVAGRATEAPPSAGEQSSNPETVGRVGRITKSAEPDVSVTPWQMQKINDYFAQHPEERVTDIDFSIAIGAAVPKQAKLRDLPGELAEALPSYKEDQYILVGDRLVIVERPTSRIVAIIPVAA